MQSNNPPAEIDIEALDEFLASESAPKDSMLLSDMDGFLTAVAIGPGLIKPSEWLPVIWRGVSPAFETAEQAEFITGQIFARYNQIRQTSAAGPNYIEPWFWEKPDGTVIAMDWCEGFFEGVQLRMDAWAALLEDNHGRTVFSPIAAHLSDATGELMTKGTSEEVAAALDRAASMIPAAVYEIRRFWKKYETV